MINKKDILLLWVLVIMVVFLTIVGIGTYMVNKANEEKELIKPFKMLKGDATYEMKCLDGYAYILYKERNSVSISQMMIDNSSSSDRPRLAHCKED